MSVCRLKLYRERGKVQACGLKSEIFRGVFLKKENLNPDSSSARNGRKVDRGSKKGDKNGHFQRVYRGIQGVNVMQST